MLHKRESGVTNDAWPAMTSRGCTRRNDAEPALQCHSNRWCALLSSDGASGTVLPVDVSHGAYRLAPPY